MNPELENWLSWLYRAKIERDPDKIAEHTRIIRSRLEADAGLRQAAQDELTRLKSLADALGGPSTLRQRCFVSATHLETLSSVLSN